MNHLDVCGCLKQVQYLSIRLGPLLDTIHTICAKFTTKVKHFQLTSRHIWAQKNRRKSFANTLAITEVPIGMDGLHADSHTRIEPRREQQGLHCTGEVLFLSLSCVIHHHVTK